MTKGVMSPAAAGAWTPTTSPSCPPGTSLLNMAAASAAAMPSPPSNLQSPSTPNHTRPLLTPSPHHSGPGPSPGPSPGPPQGPSGVSALSWAESQLTAELLAQSAAPRLLLRNLSMAKVKLLIDLHVADAGPNIPFGLDTHR